MRDEFAWLKSNWLEAVASDATLTESAARLAVMIAMHLNRKTGTAQVSIGLLAWELKKDERNVRKLIEQLLARGLLKATGGRGRGVSRVYQPMLPSGYRPLLERVAERSKKEGVMAEDAGRNRPLSADQKAGDFIQNTGRNHPPNPLKNPYTRAHARGGAAEGSKGSRWTWAEFELSWKNPLGGDRDAAQEAFEGLSPFERILVIGFVEAGRERAAERGSDPCGPLQWLDEGFKACVPAIRPGRTRVAQGSVQFEAWDAVWRAAKGKGLPIDRRGEWLVESEFPPGFGLPPQPMPEGRASAPASEGAAA
jgi:hypothetical protein